MFPILETTLIFTNAKSIDAVRYFKTIFLEDAKHFLEQLDDKTRLKVIYNIDKAEQCNDPKLFKKLDHEIWEFRTRHMGRQIRLFAFWDTTEKNSTLVIATHGAIKKYDRIKSSDFQRALQWKERYFNDK